ncbi:hypothetical protein [Nannocystis punicea]|uniref:DUF5753 domain-containing protein n=1 Tax=Nannocystis punicea TaxID=2995304 RepID=A0ABY7GW10_9BACT|nr:hypothetical protein [Nannocystis poenicansa]WAS91143.1 hypothetical protein O0S08_33570 [Nannocystis poenicansa]
MTQAYQPTLHRFPDDTAGRFQVIREFLLRWHGLDTGAVGRTVERVGAAEARVGKALPLAVREWIVLLDDLARIGGWGRVLRDSWGLVKVPNCAAFSLLTGGENDRHWGPMFRDLAREDPPTHEFVPDYERSESRFKRGRQVAPRVSTWAIEFIVSYLHLSKCVQLERAISKPLLDRVRSRSPGLVVASQIGHTELFEFEDGLLHAEPDGPTSYQLRCYAPYLGTTRAAYQGAAREFAERVDAILLAARL